MPSFANSVELVSVTKANLHLLSTFLKNEEKSLAHFRYFEKRSLEVVFNHLATYILIFKEEPIGYGHLDKESDIVWLGIAISREFRGMGLGRLMTQVLISTGRLNKVDSVHLSVDNNNLPAKSLYMSLGFKLFEKRDKISFYRISL